MTERGGPRWWLRLCARSVALSLAPALAIAGCIAVAPGGSPGGGAGADGERGLGLGQEGWSTSAPQARRAPESGIPWARAVASCQAMFDSKNDGSWRAADGNVTVSLPRGRIAWLFGDTHRAGRRFIHNSVLVQEGRRLTSTTGGQAVPDDRDGSYYWPTEAIMDGGALRVFLGRVTKENGPFENTGVALATFRFDERGYPMFAGKKLIMAYNEDVGIQWGTAAVRDGDYVYVYGQRRRQGLFGRDVYLARAPAGELVDTSSWRYWAGAGWTESQGLAAAVEPAESGRFASSFSVDKVGESWVVVSKELDIAGDQILEMRADRPTGPFVVTRTLPAPSDDLFWTYQAKAHTELPLTDGRVLVTWNIAARYPKAQGSDYGKPQCGAP